MKRLVLLALPALLLAQTPQPVPQDPAKARLEGQVLNSVTNEPLRMTRLTLRMNVAAMTTQRGQQPGATSTYTVTSDAAGRFEFANVDPGDYQLTVRRDGFANLVLGAKYTAHKTDPILLNAGDRKADFLVRLVPYGSISGSVLDEDGDPIREMAVLAMTWHYTTNGRELQEARGASTNDLGEFRIFDVPAGKYFIKVGQRKVQINSGPDSAEDYASVYYPGFPQVSGAIVQEVTPGAQLRNLIFNLRKVRYATIRGRVAAPPNASSVDAGMMMVSDNSSTSTSTNTTGKDFHFEFFGVAPGPIYLTASYILNGKRHSTSLPIEVAGTDIDGIELRPSLPWNSADNCASKAKPRSCPRNSGSHWKRATTAARTPPSGKTALSCFTTSRPPPIACTSAACRTVCISSRFTGAPPRSPTCRWTSPTASRRAPNSPSCSAPTGDNSKASSLTTRRSPAIPSPWR
jgi:hypothetical protein